MGPPSDKVYVVGCGAVGAPLAACLAEAGREVVMVRTSEPELALERRKVRVRLADRELVAEVPSIGLSRLREIKGIIAVATKAHFNERLAECLRTIPTEGPLVILQNGLGVERPFVKRLREIFRAVLYVTGEGTLESGFEFRAVSPSPLWCESIHAGGEPGGGGVYLRNWESLRRPPRRRAR